MSSLLPVPEYRLVHSSSDMTEHAKRPVPEVGQATTGLERRALVAAADHTRELVDAIVRLDIDSPAAPELNERLESVLEFLRRHVQPAEAMIHDPSIESWEDFVDRSPVSGRLNPLAPPLDFAIGDETTLHGPRRDLGWLTRAHPDASTAVSSPPSWTILWAMRRELWAVGSSPAR